MPLKEAIGLGAKARPYPCHVERIRGRKLQGLRDRLFVASEGRCASCRAVLMPGRWIRDHVVPLAEGGADVLDNTQALCLDCSDRKSQQEARRGQARSHVRT